MSYVIEAATLGGMRVNGTLVKIFIGMLIIGLVAIPIAIIITVFKYANEQEKKKRSR